MNEHQRSPYVGPRPFEVGEPIFGRGVELMRLANLLLARRIVLMFSPSGAGKTSLIQAGLIPLLRGEQPSGAPDLNQALVSPGEFLIADHTIRVSAKVHSPSVNPHSVATLNTLGIDPSALEIDPAILKRDPATGSRRLKEALGPDRRVLIFDQFEELITHDPTNLATKYEFMSQLAIALADGKLLALFAMREEHLAALDPYLHLFPNRLEDRFRLDFLNVSAAHEAIVEPARRAKVQIEENAVELLVEGLRQTRTQGAEGSVASPYIQPVQLQVLMANIWGRRTHPNRIIEADVKRAGTFDKTLEEALGDYYEDEIKAAASANNLPERILRNWIELNLILMPACLRIQVPQEHDSTRGLANSVLNNLVARYLLRIDMRSGIPWYELAHDRLVQPVLDRNAAWRPASVGYLGRVVEWHRKGRDPRYLLDEAALNAVRDEGIGATLSDEERGFLQASRKALEQAKRAEQATDLNVTGWGLIFPALDINDPQEKEKRDHLSAIKKALQPLIAHRARQAGSRLCIFESFLGYRKGDSVNLFLERQGLELGVVNLERVPYHLLIVAPPDWIPFEFQSVLAVRYSVGRLWFDDVADFERYARRIVEIETMQAAPPRRLTLFGPNYVSDRRTDSIVETFFPALGSEIVGNQPRWAVETHLGTDATKSQFGAILNEADTPSSVLFVVSSGVYAPQGDDQRATLQGSIICSGWLYGEKVTSDYYFGSEDLTAEARPTPLIYVLASPYSAGTTTETNTDGMFRADRELALPLSNKPFIGRLAQRLLAHPNSCALAVISHVNDMSMDAMFVKDRPNMTLFANLLWRITEGHTMGSALTPMRQNHQGLASQLAEQFVEQLASCQMRATQEVASLSTEKKNLLAYLDIRDYQGLASRLDEQFTSRQMRATQEVQSLSAKNKDLLAYLDIRDYVILGDPAAHLPVDAGDPWDVSAPNRSSPPASPEAATQEAAGPIQPGYSDEPTSPDEEHDSHMANTAEPPQLPLDNDDEAADPDDMSGGSWERLPDASFTDSGRLYVNGVTISSGQYAHKPLSVVELAQLAAGEPLDLDREKAARQIDWRKKNSHLGVIGNRRLENLDEVGWAVIMRDDEPPEVKEAIKRLLAHRRSRRQNPELFKLLSYPTNPPPASAEAWLRLEHRLGLDIVVPERVPFYLLIVGDPTRIPFAFGQRLAMQYAVGRIAFDVPGDYAAYVDQVIRHERGESPSLARDVLFFGPRIETDEATKYSYAHLISPLIASGVVERHQYRPTTLLAQKATKRALRKALLGVNHPPPALLFGATHGAVFDPPVIPAQTRAIQGSLVCQTWPGPGNPVTREDRFEAEDVGDGSLAGMVAFLFGCFSGGTPTHDGFAFASGASVPLSPEPFLAALPTALLRRGAIACVGHIDRSWPSSFFKSGIETQRTPFEETVDRLLTGYPVGFALRHFADRFAVASVQISDAARNWRFHREDQEATEELARLWLERTDANGYLIIGDPAVSLRPHTP